MSDNDSKSSMPTETTNWSALTPEQEKEYIGTSPVKCQIYEMFKQKHNNKLSPEEESAANYVLLSIIRHSMDGIQLTLHLGDINLQQVYEECSGLLNTEEQIIRIFTYLFLQNQIIVSKSLRDQDAFDIRDKDHNPWYALPRDEHYENFINGISEMFNHNYSRVIYTTPNCKSVNKIFSENFLKLTQQQTEIDKNLRGIEDKQNELLGIRSHIITIVALLVSIVPLLTVNLQVISNNFSFQNILIINGILFILIGIVFYLINGIVNKQEDPPIKAWIFIIIGILFILISIVIFNAICKGSLLFPFAMI